MIFSMILFVIVVLLSGDFVWQWAHILYANSVPQQTPTPGIPQQAYILAGPRRPRPKAPNGAKMAPFLYP